MGAAVTRVAPGGRLRHVGAPQPPRGDRGLGRRPPHAARRRRRHRDLLPHRAIALNAVLDADIHVGETVAVFGQGVPGLLCAQLAARNGGDVAVVDGIRRRLELAQRLGARHAIDFTAERPAEAIKALTGGRGADVSIEISGAAAALNEAVRATAYSSRVVASGFIQGGADALLLGEEFHHNRIELTVLADLRPLAAARPPLGQAAPVADLHPPVRGGTRRDGAADLALLPGRAGR